MEKNFRYPFLFSLIFHLLLFYSTSRWALKKIVSVPIPIELIRISLPASAPAEVKPVTQKARKTEEITVPKKEKKEAIKKKEEVKKEEPAKSKEVSEEKKIVSPSPQPARLPLNGVTPGSGVSVESAKFHYTYYLNLIRERIGKNWNWSVSETKKKTIIYFRILKDGSVSQIKTKESSKDESFDLAGLRAVETSAPFPPLPAGFPEDYLGVYFEFSLQ